jgi:hypothetical protein
MRYFTLFSKKKIGQDISKKLRKFRGDLIQKSIFSKQHPLAVLREEASDRLLPDYQV